MAYALRHGGWFSVPTVDADIDITDDWTPSEPDPRVLLSSAEGQMDPEGCCIRACFDPGLFTDQRTDPANQWLESLHRWQARAVIEALTIAGYDLTPLPGSAITPERNHD